MTELTLYFGGVRVVVRVAAADLRVHLQRLQRVFPQWVLAPRDCPSGSYEVVMEAPGETGSIWLSSLIEALTRQMAVEGYGVFHGALLANAEHFLLVSGPSEAGKSMFSIGMQTCGYVPFADDLLFLRTIDGGVQAVPIPRIIMSRAPQYRGQRHEPIAPPGSVLIPYEQLTLLFPRFSDVPRCEPILRQKAIFGCLLDANIYTSEIPSRLHVANQLRVRSKLAANCRATRVEYCSDIRY